MCKSRRETKPRPAVVSNTAPEIVAIRNANVAAMLDAMKSLVPSAVDKYIGSLGTDGVRIEPKGVCMGFLPAGLTDPDEPAGLTIESFGQPVKTFSRSEVEVMVTVLMQFKYLHDTLGIRLSRQFGPTISEALVALKAA